MSDRALFRPATSKQIALRAIDLVERNGLPAGTSFDPIIFRGRARAWFFAKMLERAYRRDP